MSRLKSKVPFAGDWNAKLSRVVVAKKQRTALSQTVFCQRVSEFTSTLKTNIINGRFNGRTGSTDCLGKENGNRFPGG
jgi:hypothetical protein